MSKDGAKLIGMPALAGAELAWGRSAEAVC